MTAISDNGGSSLKTVFRLLTLAGEMRWSYLPPLMVYLAAGISGLTAIVSAFFIKEYLGLSAAFLASLAFWAGIPWALKMPLGHLVDLIWRWKSALVYLGALLIAASLCIMYGLIAHPVRMTAVMSIVAWYVWSALLAPIGYVVQDVVADAMTVEAVPETDDRGRPYPEDQVKRMHTTMQTLGRVAFIGGFVLVAVVNIGFFAGVEGMSAAEKASIYETIYLVALVIPLISVAGVTYGEWLLRARQRRLVRQGMSREAAEALLFQQNSKTKPNWWIFGGAAVFVAFTLGMGLGQIPLAQELILLGSLAIVMFLIHRLILELDPAARHALIGTAIIIFVFRAVPLPGPGVTWWEIDILGFDQQFLSVLTLITSALALVAMLLLRPFIARKSIASIVALLALASGLLALPNIGLFYGLHEWTAARTGGVVDARFIAVFDTALESPLSQIAMIPMLAWIAKNAPAHLKATFFAIMASFTNLALSTSSLGTKYLNQAYHVTREVLDPQSGEVAVAADYGEVGWLLITVALIALLLPLLAIWLVQHSRYRTRE